MIRVQPSCGEIATGRLLYIDSQHILVFYFTFLSAGEPIKKCAVADEKEEMRQVCRYVGSRRAEAYIHTP